MGIPLEAYSVGEEGGGGVCNMISIGFIPQHMLSHPGKKTCNTPEPKTKTEYHY